MSTNIHEVISSRMELPVIVAPMFLVSGPEMVIETCRSGIIGSFPLANARTLVDLDAWMCRIREGLKMLEKKSLNAELLPGPLI